VTGAHCKKRFVVFLSPAGKTANLFYSARMGEQRHGKIEGRYEGRIEGGRIGGGGWGGRMGEGEGGDMKEETIYSWPNCLC
jgi:hypothetical protein